MSRSPIEYLRHILDEIDYIEGILRNMDKERFLRDQTLKCSVVHSIEIIEKYGERMLQVPKRPSE